MKKRYQKYVNIDITSCLPYTNFDWFTKCYFTKKWHILYTSSEKMQRSLIFFHEKYDWQWCTKYDFSNRKINCKINILKWNLTLHQDFPGGLRIPHQNRTLSTATIKFYGPISGREWRFMDKINFRPFYLSTHTVFLKQLRNALLVATSDMISLCKHKFDIHPPISPSQAFAPTW